MAEVITNSRYKYQSLKAYLMDKIRSFDQSNGGKLESELQLCRKFNLSRNTTRQALNELEQEGYVYRVHGSGTFIRCSQPKQIRKIALLIYDSAYMVHPVTGAMIKGISEILESNGFVLDVLASKRSFHDENITKLAENYAGFLVGTYQLDELTLLELGKMSKPYLFVKNYISGKEPFAVLIDFQHAGFIVAEHLANQGYHNVALLYSGDAIAISRDFKQGVISGALEYGIKLRRENIHIVNFSDKEAIPGIAKELLGHQERVDAIVCSSDELGVAMVMELKKHVLNQHIAVTGCNNMEYSKFCDPQLTTVDIHIEEVGRQAALALLNGINGGEISRQILTPELIVRGSTPNTGKI